MKTLLLLPVLFVATSLPMSRPTAVDQPLGEHDWVVDGAHSSVVFRVKHAGASWFQGTFDKVDGKITLDPASPAKGSVELTIPVASVDTNNEKRDGHLKAPDFFNAKENPDITFRSSKITAQGETLQVTGELAMAGKKQEITIPVTKTGAGEFYGKPVAGFMAEFTIKRSDFGMTYGVAKDALGDAVTLMIALEVTKAQ